MRTRIGTNQYRIKPRARALLLTAPLAITVYIGWKAKRWLFISSMILFLGWSINYLAPHAFSPFAHADKPYTGYETPTLNPDLTEREQNMDLIKRIWGKDASIGLNIAFCESGFRTHAENRNKDFSLDQGIFQINSIHGMPEMETAVANISTAYLMYKEQGTGPWYSSERCWKSL